MNDNKCLFCGEIIPEGRQLCPTCETREKGQTVTVKTIIKMTEQQKQAVEDARRETEKDVKEKTVKLIEKVKKTLTQECENYRRNADEDADGLEDTALHWYGQADATQRAIDLLDEHLQEFKGEEK